MPTFELGASKDNYISASSQSSNYSTLTYMYVVDYLGEGTERISLLAFDVSALAGATVTSATLLLSTFSVAGLNNTHWAYKLLHNDWVESQSSFDNKKTGTTWTSGDFSASDYTTDNGVSAVFDAPYAEVEWVITAIVQDAIDNTIDVNLAIMGESPETSGPSYRTKEHATVATRPKLTIVATVAPTVTTQTCTDVVGTTAIGRGNITDLGDTITAHGHVWDTSANPTTNNDYTDNGAASATGPYLSAIQDLTPGTEYFTRAYATNSAGTSYGENVSFIAPTTEVGGRAGYAWMEGSNLRGFDENAIERKYIHTDDVDDAPVDAATTDPISSNWAYDHLNDEDVHDAVQVNVSELGAATYDDVQDYINFFGDRTLLSGGAITDNGDGTVAIASLTAWSAASDSETAVGKFFDWAGGNTSALTDMTTNYIYLDYNGGTPRLVLATDILTHGFKLDHIHIATAFRDGTLTHFHKPTNFELDLGATVDMHHSEEDLVHRVDGMITTGTGTRNLSLTAGVLYEGLNRHTSLPFDTSRSGTADFDEVNKLHDADGDFSENDVGKSVHNTTDNTYGTITAFVDSGELTLAADTFPDGNEAYNIDFWTYHYYDGDLGTPAWVEVHGATQISNTQYNDVATGLDNFTANRYGVSWVFMEIDGQHFHVVYGQGDYKANEAEEAGVPSSLPNIVTNYCALIAKIILRQGQTTMTITYPWTTMFTSSFATDHGSLGGLSDVADHAYALLHSGTRALSGAWNMASQLITNLKLGGALDANSQNLTNAGTIGCADVTVTGTTAYPLTISSSNANTRIKVIGLSDAAGIEFWDTTPTKLGSFNADVATGNWIQFYGHTGVGLRFVVNGAASAAITISTAEDVTFSGSLILAANETVDGIDVSGIPAQSLMFALSS